MSVGPACYALAIELLSGREISVGTNHSASPSRQARRRLPRAGTGDVLDAADQLVDVRISMEIMRRQGVTVDLIWAVDHDIARGVWPEMTDHGWPSDEWPAIFERVKAAHILVL